MQMPDPLRLYRAGGLPGRRAALLGAMPGMALAAMGAGILLLALGQPAWLGNDVGPGLMAQLLGKGIIALGLLWALIGATRPEAPAATNCMTETSASARNASGPALLGGVLVFALALPWLGMVIAAGLAATLAALGAGERAPRALALTVLGLSALTAAIGLVLLPPTAPLWPRFTG
jgi:hypothetical protein